MARSCWPLDLRYGDIRPLTSVAEHTLAMPTTNCRCRPHTMWLEIEEERENRAYTQQIHQPWPELCIGDGKSELSLLSCSGKLYIQLYPSSPSIAAMLLQLLDVTAGLTLAPAPAAATVQQQGALFGVAFSCCAFIQGMQRRLCNKFLLMHTKKQGDA